MSPATPGAPLPHRPPPPEPAALGSTADTAGGRQRPSGPGRGQRAGRRDRRGRGLRGPLLSPGVPNSRTRAEVFDHAVLQTVGELELLWGPRLGSVEFAVDEVPPLPSGPVLPSSDVVLDNGVPLSRFVPPGVDRRGRATRARIVVYRRPIEGRAVDADDVADLVAQVLRDQVASVLGEPDGPRPS